MKALRMAILFAAAAALGRGQITTNTNLAPDCLVFFNFTAVGNSVNFDNSQRACTGWTVGYTNSGFSAISLIVQSSPDLNGAPSGFVTFAGTVLSGINPNTAITQASTNLQGYFPWMRVRLDSVTGSGRVRGILYGFREKIQTTPISGTVTANQGTAAAQSSRWPVFWSDGSAERIGQQVMASSIPVAIASNQSTLTTQGGSAQGAAIAGNPFVAAQRDSSNNTQTEFRCDQQAAITLTAAGNTEIIALTAAQTIRICHVSIAMAASQDVKFTRGTGANCATGTADVTGLYRSVTSLALDFTNKAPLVGASGEAICVNQSAATNSGGVVIFAKF